MGTNGATIMILEIYTYTPTLPLITFIIHGISLKIKVTQSPLEESRKRPGHGEQDSSKVSAHHEKTLHTGNARLH